MAIFIIGKKKHDFSIEICPPHLDKPNLRDHWIETVAEVLNPKKNKDKDKETTPDANPAP